jgi:uncharacterized MAPEG superfamily protein
MGLFSLNGTFMEIFIPFNLIVVIAPAIIVGFLKKFELSMLGASSSQIKDAPYMLILAYVPLILVTNLVTVMYMATHTAKGYDNSYSRVAKGKLTGLPQRMEATHKNTLEGLPILLAGIFVARDKDLNTEVLAKLCALIFGARLLFIVMYYTNMDLLRTTTWLIGFLSTICMVSDHDEPNIEVDTGSVRTLWSAQTPCREVPLCGGCG